MPSNTMGDIIHIALQGSFYLITLIFVVFSLSIAYHLLAYSTNKTKSLLMLAIYLGVSAFLFISMFLALASI